MSYKVLARKWRPRTFEEVVGQGHITQSLQNAIKNENFGHAYLFTGTRGIGKTTCARIFAKALTCQNLTPEGNPCLECGSCKGVDADTNIDVQEIDGASHNGVENIRALIENAHYLPVGGKFKVYIIDEVHMLSTSAFNALLKTLEEPPEHVIFLLATTDPEKLLKTVLSRCQRFDFRNATIETLFGHVKNILGKEEITFTDDELIKTICKLGKGSFRDTLSLVDQVLSYTLDKEINEENVSTALGVAKSSSLANITNSIFKGDVKSLKATYHACINENVDLENLAQGLLDYFYFVIDRIDSPKSLYQMKVVEPGVLDNISGAEVFWVFETLAKDLEWSLKSIDPEKVVLIALQKLALRREFFGKDSKTISDSSGDGGEVEPEPAFAEASARQAREEVEVEEEVVAVVEETVQEEVVAEPVEALMTAESLEANVGVTEEAVEQEQQEEEQEQEQETVEEEVVVTGTTWDGFLNNLSQTEKALAANLEQGNIIGAPETTGDRLYINLGFDEGSAVFYDYVIDSSVIDRLKTALSSFFEVEIENINLEITKIGMEEKEEQNFMSISEIEDKKIEKQREDHHQRIISNPYILEAQKLFEAKVDRVILNESHP